MRKNRNWHWLVLIGSGLLLLLPGIFTRDFYIDLEARRALVALNMLRRGDWLAPHLMGEYFLTKPPLFYWLEILAIKLTGHSADWVMRLPSVVAALLGALALAKWMEGMFGRRAAFFAAAVTLLSPVYLWMGQTAEPEMAFTALGVAAMLCFGRLVELDRPDKPWEVAFYLCLALAMLDKGPLVPLIVILTVGLWLRLMRRGRPLLHVPPLWGLLLVTLPILAWLGILLARGIPVDRLFDQLSTHAIEKTGKTKAIYFYFLVMQRLVFPWHFLLLAIPAFPALCLMRTDGNRRAAGREIWAYLVRGRGERLLLVLWFAFTLLILSAISTKKVYYAATLVPPLAGVCALIYHDWLTVDYPRLGAWLRRRAGVAALCALMLSGSLLLAAAFAKWPELPRPYMGKESLDARALLAWSGLWCAGVAGLLLWAIRRRDPARWFARAATGWTFATLFVLASVYNLAVLPKINAQLSLERATRKLPWVLPPGAELVGYKENFSVCFYLGRTDLPVFKKLRDLKAFLGQHPRAIGIASGKLEDEVRQDGGFTILYTPPAIRAAKDRFCLFRLKGQPGLPTGPGPNSYNALR